MDLGINTERIEKETAPFTGEVLGEVKLDPDTGAIKIILTPNPL